MAKEHANYFTGRWLEWKAISKMTCIKQIIFDSYNTINPAGVHK